MIRHSLLLIPLLLFAACQNEVATAPVEQTSADRGVVAFRLGSAEIAALGVSSDSLRVEAFRAGRAVSATGSLAAGVLLQGLEPGAWAFKVAAYDATGSIQWYGEASCEVVAGSTVELSVTLRRATGSVHIGIVLDSGDVVVPDAPVRDTLWNAMDTIGARTSPVPSSLAGAEWSGGYVFVRTPFNCNAPSPSLVRWVDSTGVVHLLVVNRGPMTKMICAAAYSEQVLVYKPASAEETILVEDLQGHAVLLGGSLVDPFPTSFLAFAYRQSGGFVLNNASYEAIMRRDGSYQVVRTQTVWIDSASVRVSDSALGVLKPAELDTVRRLLADSALAWPTPIPAAEFICEDGAWWRTEITYADNHEAVLDKPDEICDVPAAYQKAQRVASMLLAKLPPIDVGN